MMFPKICTVGNDFASRNACACGLWAVSCEKHYSMRARICSNGHKTRQKKLLKEEAFTVCSPQTSQICLQLHTASAL